MIESYARTSKAKRMANGVAMNALKSFETHFVASAPVPSVYPVTQVTHSVAVPVHVLQGLVHVVPQVAEPSADPVPAVQLVHDVAPAAA